METKQNQNHTKEKNGNKNVKRNGQNEIVENENEKETNHQIWARDFGVNVIHTYAEGFMCEELIRIFCSLSSLCFLISLLYYMIHVTISRARLQTIYSLLCVRLCVWNTQPNTTIWCFLLFATDNTHTHTQI